MRHVIGSEALTRCSEALDEALERQMSRLHSPDTRKSDKPLRRFTVREVADLCLRINYNTLRHYLKTMDGLPTGILETGNRRSFALEEVHDLQEALYKAGKIPPHLYPRRLPGEKSTRLIVYNLKGGVSKTTTSISIAQALATRGFTVLLVDLDPQASSSDMMDIRADLDQIPSIYDVLKYENPAEGVRPLSIREVIQPTYFPNLDVLPGSLNLTEFEFETAIAARKGEPFYDRLGRAFDEIDEAYDVVICDTPPHMSFSVIAAMNACNSMLIPLSAGMLDVVSLVKFMDLAASTLESIEGISPQKRFDFIRILLTRYSQNDPAQQMLGSFLRNTLGEAMTSNVFLSSTAIADAGNTMNPLLEVEPSSFNRKTYERILENIVSIAQEIETEIMISRGRIKIDAEVA